MNKEDIERRFPRMASSVKKAITPDAATIVIVALMGVRVFSFTSPNHGGMRCVLAMWVR